MKWRLTTWRGGGQELVAETVAEEGNFTLKMQLSYFKHHANCSTVMLVPDDDSLSHITALQVLGGGCFL